MRKRVKSALKTTAKVAEAVEHTGAGVKRVARAIDRAIPNGNGNGGYSRSRNDDHKATRSSAPQEVITRSRDAALPDEGARLFVDPLDDRKQLFGESTTCLPAGVSAGPHMIGNIFDEMVYPVYQTAVIQAIRYDATAVFGLSDFRDYINLMTKALQNYYVIASQKAFLMDGDTVSYYMNLRNRENLLFKTESALRILRNALSNYCFPPNLHGYIKWISELHALGRTPNANIGQFITSDIYTASTDTDISDALKLPLGQFTESTRIISGVMGKLMPGWRMDIPDYSEMSRNPTLDFNWINLWVNHGFQNSPGTVFNPSTSFEYALFNDNPNVVCTASACIYNPTDTYWKPGLLTPDSVNGLVGRINVNGDYVGTAADSDIMLGALRWREYNNPTGTFHSPSDSSPDAVTVTMNDDDLKADTTYVMQWFFHTRELADVNQSFLRARR